MAVKRQTTPVVGALDQVKAIEIADDGAFLEAEQTLNVIRILRQELTDELAELGQAEAMLAGKLKTFQQTKEYELL